MSAPGIACMFKVYVGNLDPRVTPEILRPLFEPFGDLDEIIVATDQKSGRSRGFAIVLFRDPLKGQLAIETLTGRKVAGRTIVINEALKKGKAPPSAPARQGPFGPRLVQGTRTGSPQSRRFSSRNPRRGLTGPAPRGPGAPPQGSVDPGSTGGPGAPPGSPGGGPPPGRSSGPRSTPGAPPRRPA